MNKKLKRAPSRERFIVLLVILLCFFRWSFVAHGQPLRIVSLAPSVTEWIDALGLTGSLVGVTEQCNFPPAVKKIEKVGPFMRANVESVLMKKPTDIVAIDGLPVQLNSKFKSQGIRVHLFSVRRLADLPLQIEKLGAALGAGAQGSAWADKLQRAFQMGEHRQGRGKGATKFLLVVSMRPLFVATAESWMSDFFELVGMRNSMRDVRGSSQNGLDFVQISQEVAIQSGADRWLMFSDENQSEQQIQKRTEQLFLNKRPKNLKSLEIYPADLFTRPGPRLIEALRMIEEWKR